MKKFYVWHKKRGKKDTYLDNFRPKLLFSSKGSTTKMKSKQKTLRCKERNQKSSKRKRGSTRRSKRVNTNKSALGRGKNRSAKRTNAALKWIAPNQIAKATICLKVLDDLPNSSLALNSFSSPPLLSNYRRSFSTSATILVTFCRPPISAQRRRLINICTMADADGRRWYIGEICRGHESWRPHAPQVSSWCR